MYDYDYRKLSVLSLLTSHVQYISSLCLGSWHIYAFCICFFFVIVHACGQMYKLQKTALTHSN